MVTVWRVGAAGRFAPTGEPMVVLGIELVSRFRAVPLGNNMIQTRLAPATVGCEWVAARLQLEACVCVLLVEDEPIILMTTAFCLEGWLRGDDGKPWIARH